MTVNIVENRAEEIPFSYVLSELLETNLKQKPHKMKTFQNINGVVAINLPDIDTAITLIFGGGVVRIEKGILGKPDLIINSSSEKIISLNAINIKFGLPYYFDEAGLSVLRQLINGDLKIKGMIAHPFLLTRLTKIMSVM